MNILWHIWDGAASWVVDELIAKGGLPTLAKLRSAGVWGAASAPTPNCQTPTGLATLLTGLSPRDHGVTGFWVAGEQSRRKEVRRGFGDGVLRVLPAWQRSTTRPRVISAHVPWTIAADGAVPPRTLVATDGLNARIAREGTMWLADSESEEKAIAWPDKGSPAARLRRSGTDVELVDGDARIVLREKWTSVWSASSHGRSYRAIPSDGGIAIARSGVWATRFVGDAELVRCARAREREAGPLLGGSMGSLYRTGAFGLRISQGGTGEAERILLEAAEIVVNTMSRPAFAKFSTLHSPLAVT